MQAEQWPMRAPPLSSGGHLRISECFQSNLTLSSSSVNFHIYFLFSIPLEYSFLSQIRVYFHNPRMFLVNSDLIQFFFKFFILFVSWDDIFLHLNVECGMLGFRWILVRLVRFLEFHLNFKCYLFILMRVDLDLRRLVNSLDWTGEIRVTSPTQAWGF